MILKRLATAGMLVLFLNLTGHSAKTYLIDPVHSSTSFSVRHLMLSNVKGDFKEFSGLE